MRPLFTGLKPVARIAFFCALALTAIPMASEAQTVPTFAVTPGVSTIKFAVDASVSVSGTFTKWDSTLTFASTDPSTGVLDIKIQADSVDTGSGMKNHALKGDDFFDVENHPQITFHSNKITKTGPDTFQVDGDFSIRGVTKPEKLMLIVKGAGTGSGDIKGTMTFNRQDYGVNGSIPFVHIADRVDVNVNLKVKRTSGPALAFAK